MRTIAYLCGTTLASMIALTAGSGQAAAIFVFAGAEANVENMTFTPTVPGPPGLTVRTSGFLVGGTPAQNALADAYLTPSGLGVLNRNNLPDRSAFFNSIHVDGLNPEFLRLEFNQPVELTRVFFQNAGPGSTDRFDLMVDGVDIDVPALFGTDVIKNLAPPGQAAGYVPFPSTVPRGTVFDFIAANWGGGTFDEWNLEKVEAVPEPISLAALSALGLGWIVSRYRRRRFRVARG